MRITNFLVLIIVFVFAGCKESHYYNATTSFPEKIWKIDEYAKFSVNIDNIQNSFDIKISANINEKYPYQNLWLFSNIISPSGIVQKDTINLIFEPEFLKSSGCRKENCDYIFNFADSVKFVETGNYIFEFNQGLRQDNVSDINSISLIIDKNK